MEYLQRLLALFLSALNLKHMIDDLQETDSQIAQAPPESTQTAQSTPATPPATQRIYAAAFAAIGRDLTTVADNDVGCAESLSRVLKHVYPDFPTILNTADLNRYFKENRDRFTPTLYPKAGVIAVMPTEGSNHGHCWVIGKIWAMSNTSATGKWEANYRNSELDSIVSKRGLKLFYYIPQ